MTVSEFMRRECFTQAEARSHFLRIVREVHRGNKKRYVADKAGKRFMTLSRNVPDSLGATETVSAQFFKDHLARFSCLIKTDFAFVLTLRDKNIAICARRHTHYVDPLDPLLARFRTQRTERLLEEAMCALQEINARVGTEAGLSKILDAISESSDELKKSLQLLAQGLARVAIGHRPFEEGVLGASIGFPREGN